MPQRKADHARPQQGRSPSRRRGLASTGGRAAEQERDRDVRHTSAGFLRLLVLVVFLTAAYALIHDFRDAPALSQRVPASPSLTTAPSAAPAPETAAPIPSPVPTPSGAASPSPLPIGIVAGHWGSDSGAVCEGWLREVDINLSIARRVVHTLRAMGYPTDLLEEFDPRLEGYRARLLLSIHADSCLYPEASGFKVARVEDSAVPDIEDQLVNCLIDRYQSRTGLIFHEGSITPDMIRYHTFYEIDPTTPGAIIEVGFMLADRDLLLNQQDLIAQGIVEGIRCFLEESR